MNSSKLFLGGLPTKAEVDTLMALTATRKEGEIVTKDEVEKAIGCSTKSDRSKGIIRAWKNRAFRECNLLLVAVPGEGYRLADPKERITTSSSLVNAGRRRIVRAAVVAETTDQHRLDEPGRKLRDHIRTIPARLKLAALCAPKT